MFRKFSILFLFFLPIASFSQSFGSKADSLLHLLPNAKDVDKVEILLKLSEEFGYEVKGLDYANQALDIANKLNDSKIQAQVLFAIGRYYYENFDEAKSLEYYFKSIELSKRLDDKPSIIRTLRSIGRSYFYLDSIDNAKSYTLQAIELSVESSNRILQAEALLDLADIYTKEFKHEDALKKIYESLSLMEEHGTPSDLVKVYYSLGRQYYNMGEYKKSIENFLKEIEIKESVNDFRGLVSSHHNLGRTHRTIGNFQLALEQYQKSLSISEKLGDKRLIAANNSEIGLVYENLSRSLLAVEDNEVNFRRALTFHEAALKIYQEEQNLDATAQTLNNIANTYSRLAINEFVAKYGEFWEDSLYQISANVIMVTFGKAFEYYTEALDVFEQIDNTREIINTNINLGSHYIFARNWSKANEHLGKGLIMARRINSQYEIALALFHYGDYFFRQKNFENAEQNLLQSLKITESLGVKDVVMHTNQRLAKVYEQEGNLQKSLKHFKIYNLIKDEIFSEQSLKIITEMQTKYETEKKEQELKLMRNQDELQKSVIQRQKLTLAITIGGLVVILAFAVLLVNMVRQKQRANKILEEKNELISHQKQEITDSIRYASRIQKAVLPSTTILKESLKEHFVLFLPRDIVSGDFYWFTKQQNKMVLVAADCTGHGVPGAFMSMLGVSFLYEIVNKEGIMEPARILNILRDFIKLTLSQTGKQDEQKDGMDISLSTLDLVNMKLEWAGAYNPLVLIRNNEVIEYKADKMPVAIHVSDHQPFTNHVIDLQPGDVFYMYSDGFPDQFGGGDGRKYMSKRFKQFLLDVHQKPMEEQKEILHQEHLNWRGETDQIDDIVIFGVRV